MSAAIKLFFVLAFSASTLCASLPSKFEVNSEANTRRIAHVESCFGNSGVPLAVPGRALVGEGSLVKMCRKKPKPRQFFLFNDILVYGTIIISKRKFSNQHIIKLEDLDLQDLPDDGELKNGWQIKTLKKSFSVYAATSTEKREWMFHIKKCIDDLFAKSGKLSSGGKEKAAVWVPDPEAPVCMRCNKTKFTVVQRRHHCRKCGNVVCNACSSKKYLLADISKNPVRVCDVCYDTLIKHRRTVDAVVTHPRNNVVVASNSSGEEESDDEDDNEVQAQNPEPDETKFYREAM